MNVVGALRVKNEARWIKRAIESILPICDSVVVFDDASTDGTVAICRAIRRVAVFRSVFTTLDESRDKNLLMRYAMSTSKVDWLLMIDGDEVLMPGKAASLRLAMQTTKSRALALPVWYLWDREDQRRVDGVYANMSRVSAFRPGAERFESTAHGGNFHCGNAPQGILGRVLVDAPLLHFGYMDRADRLRKYSWYNGQDPDNEAEDRYRHVVQGDMSHVPASAKLKHAGPLKLELFG